MTSDSHGEPTDGKSPLGEEELLTIFHSVDNAIFVFDAESGAVIDVNQTGLDLYGYTREEAKQLDIADLSSDKPPGTRQLAREAIQNAAAGEETVFDWHTRNSTGESFWVEASIRKNDERAIAVLRNNADREHHDQDHSEQREQYATLVEQSPAGVVIVQDEEFKFVNQSMADLTGRSVEELEGTRFDEVIAPEYRELVRSRYAQRMSGQSPPSRYEVELLTTEGDRRVTDLTVSTVTYEDEPATMATFNDVTERIERKRELESVRERIEFVLDATDSIVYEIDLESDRQTRLGPFKRVFGLSEERAETSEEFYQQAVHPDDSADIERRQQELIEDTEVETIEYEYRTHPENGDIRWLRSEAYVRTDEDGTPTTLVGFATDITDEKAHERAFESYEILFENTSDCIVTTDMVDGVPIVRNINAAFEEVFGYTESEIVGENLDDFIVPEEYEDEAKEINRRVQDGERFTKEVTRETADGQREFLMRSVSFNNEKFYVIYTDIHDLKERERELQQTKQELEQSNEKLERFAYVASHDLQEPLRMVSSYMDLLEAELGGQLDDEVQEYLAFAVDGAERMREMIDGLLQYSRVQTRAESFEPVDAGDVVDDILQNLELLVEESGATVDVGTLPMIQADENQLGQLFQNLLTNAIDHGGENVHIEIGATQDEDGVTFTVADDGPGIPEKRQETIFDIFDKGVDSDGTGIGLAVCEEIVERHGGSIWVESQVEDGTSIRFTIPADPG